MNGNIVMNSELLFGSQLRESSIGSRERGQDRDVKLTVVCETLAQQEKAEVKGQTLNKKENEASYS